MSTRAATSALQKAHDAVDQRDFRQALGYALDARERAKESARQAADGKAQARSAAEGQDCRHHRPRPATRSAPQGRRRGPRGVARSARQPGGAGGRPRQVLQKARTAFAAGDYQQAADALTGIREKLDAATRETAAEVQRQGHRKK